VILRIVLLGEYRIGLQVVVSRESMRLVNGVYGLPIVNTTQL
jgi:hypothetical protein